MSKKNRKKIFIVKVSAEGTVCADNISIEVLADSPDEAKELVEDGEYDDVIADTSAVEAGVDINNVVVEWVEELLE